MTGVITPNRSASGEFVAIHKANAVMSGAVAGSHGKLCSKSDALVGTPDERGFGREGTSLTIP